MSSFGFLFPNQTAARNWWWWWWWFYDLTPVLPSIVVYGAYFITTVQGDIYYRESRDCLEKSRVTSLIRKHKNDQFIPTYLWIITWDDVHEYSLDNKVSIEEGIIFTF